MEGQNLLKHFAWLYFGAHTLCLLMVIDLLLFSKLNLTIFVLALLTTIYFNFRLYRTGFLQKKLRKGLL